MENQENIEEIQGSPTTHTESSSNRLSNVEIDRRVSKCAELRYNADDPITQSRWIEYCRATYGDKSVPTYLNYWMKAKDQYEEEWRGKLDTLLVPAQRELRELLNHQDPRVRSDAIKMIMKYSGNDIQKHMVAVQNISVGFQED